MAPARPGRPGPRKAARRCLPGPRPPGPAKPPVPSSTAKMAAGAKPESSSPSCGSGWAIPAATPAVRTMAAATKAMRLEVMAVGSFSVRALKGGSLFGPGCADTVRRSRRWNPRGAVFLRRARVTKSGVAPASRARNHRASRAKASCYGRRVGTAPRLADLPWSEVDALDRDRAVCILPVGAVEAHGPHLPLTTDGIIAAAMADERRARLAERDLLPLLLPPFEYTTARFAAGFSGTLSVARRDGDRGARRRRPLARLPRLPHPRARQRPPRPGAPRLAARRGGAAARARTCSPSSPTSRASRGRCGWARSSGAAPATPAASRPRWCWRRGRSWCAKRRAAALAANPASLSVAIRAGKRHLRGRRRPARLLRRPRRGVGRGRPRDASPRSAASSPRPCWRRSSAGNAGSLAISSAAMTLTPLAGQGRRDHRRRPWHRRRDGAAAGAARRGGGGGGALAPSSSRRPSRACAPTGTPPSRCAATSPTRRR